MVPTTQDARPDGPAAAAFIAAGVGSLVLGIAVVLNEASSTIKSAVGIDFNAFLQFDKGFGIGSGVGPLSGKVTLAVIAYAVSWLILHAILRRRDVDFRRAFIASLVLVALGFALTFPPIFLLFAPAE